MPAFRLRGEAHAPKDDLSATIGTPGNPYPAQIVEPPKDQEKPFSSNDQVPYRGAVPHGVGIHTDLSGGNTDLHLQGVMEPYTPGEDEKATVVPVPTGGQDFGGAVPVRIVSGAPELSLRKRFTVQTITINVGEQTKRILPFRFNRTKAKIYLKPLAIGGTADRIWLGNDEGFATNSAFPIDPGDAAFETNTTDDIWCTLDPSGTHGSMVIVYVEYEIEALTESELNPGKASKHAKHH